MTQIKDTPHDCFTIISLNIYLVKKIKEKESLLEYGYFIFKYGIHKGVFSCVQLSKAAQKFAIFSYWIRIHTEF